MGKGYKLSVSEIFAGRNMMLMLVLSSSPVLGLPGAISVCFFSHSQAPLKGCCFSPTGSSLSWASAVLGNRGWCYTREPTGTAPLCHCQTKLSLNEPCTAMALHGLQLVTREGKSHVYLVIYRQKSPLFSFHSSEQINRRWDDTDFFIRP